LISSAFVIAQTNAGEIEPRAYSNTPVGMNFLLAGYTFSNGSLVTQGSSPLKNARLTVHTGIAAYARSFQTFGNSSKFDIIIPFSGLSGSATVQDQRVERQVFGLNDPRIRYSINFYGAEAMSLKEFAQYRQKLIVGASIQVSIPVGQYDEEKLVNIGNHRWYFKPDIGISKRWGGFTLEFSTGVMVFTVNDDYFGGNKLEQAPVSTSQLHATFNAGRGIWIAVSGTYDLGGRTTVNGTRSDDFLNSFRIGATLVLPVNRNNSIKLYGGTGVYTGVGTDFDILGIVWQFRWGNGL
jgi:hypothetical protein